MQNILSNAFSCLASKRLFTFYGCVCIYFNIQIKVVLYLPLSHECAWIVRSCMLASYVLLLRSKSQLVRQSAYPHSTLQGSANKHGAWLFWPLKGNLGLLVPCCLYVLFSCLICEYNLRLQIVAPILWHWARHLVVGSPVLCARPPC